MRVAIVGGGISGMLAAFLLNRSHDITVFEAGEYVGGHTNTVTVEDTVGPVDIDTGFIVYNEWTYPNFCRLLKALDVQTQASNMSFSVRDEAADVEYKGDNLNTLFAQRSNLWRPGHYRLLYEIIRFYRKSRELLRHPENSVTLGAYVRERGFSSEFVERYLIPVGAAIWSANPQQFHEFPAAYFVRFCHNHGMLNVLRRPQWRVIAGGSQRYVAKLTASYRDHVRLRTPVTSIRRSPEAVEITTATGGRERFDHAILATHSDQSLRLLADASPTEREILGAMRYQRNEVALHRDQRLLPRRRRAWSSWNYSIRDRGQETATMTYNMNMLQSLATRDTYCVTLNSIDHIDAQSVIRTFSYDHPIYTPASVAAQKRWAEISGVNRTHYCGAYWGYGFHEDGVNSALAVGRAFGEEL